MNKYSLTKPKNEGNYDKLIAGEVSEAGRKFARYEHPH